MCAASPQKRVLFWFLGFRSAACEFRKQAVICLTEAISNRPYSRALTAYLITEFNGQRMSRKNTEIEAPTTALKNESSRQRWEMFHRAIAYAKQTNDEALLEADGNSGECKGSGPLLSIVR